MKKLLVAILPALLTGCSYYNNYLERMDTDTLVYQCDEQSLTVKRVNARKEVRLIMDNTPVILTQGLSASGVRYTDGIYVFWEKGDEATVYKRDHSVLNNCQLIPRR